MFDMCARVLHSVFGQLAHVKLDSESKKETGILYARVVFLESFRHVQIALWPIVCRLQNAYDTNAFRWLRVPAVHVHVQCATAAAFRYHLRVRVFLEHLKPVNRFGQPAYVYIGVWSAGFA